MVILQAYMDESGNLNSDDSVYVVAGFISTAERWQQFSDEWVNQNLSVRLKGRKALSKENNGKASDCWIISELIQKHALYRVECAVHLASYMRCARGRIDRVVDSPYFWAFHGAIERICRTATALNYQEASLDLFFDVNEVERKVERWYDLARTCIVPEDCRRLLPPSINWKTDEEFLPLKSADLLVGLARREHNDDVSGLEHIVRQIGKVPIVTDSGPLDEEYFNRSLSSSPAEFSGKEFEIWKERWDEGNSR
jgi:hypothetical protein